MLAAGSHDVDAGCVDAAMAQHVRQLSYVVVYRVEFPGEQMPQVVWKHFLPIYSRRIAEGFHLMEDVASVHGPAALCYKNASAFQAPLFDIAAQLPA